MSGILCDRNVSASDRATASWRTGGAYAADESRLMARLCNGDVAALDLLLERFWTPLVRFARHHVGSVDAAEDIVQESFIRLWERRSEWEPDGSPAPLLYYIARNLARNERRSYRVRAAYAERNSNMAHPPSQSPADAVEANELRAAIVAAVEALPLRRREVFVLARFQDLTHREIGAAMDVSPQTVANQLSSALTSLRKSLRTYARQ